MMPRLDGFGLLARCAPTPTCATVPVILLSARAGEEARVEGLRRRAPTTIWSSRSRRASCWRASRRNCSCRAPAAQPSATRALREEAPRARNAQPASAARSPPSSISSAPCRSVTDAATELTGAEFGAFFYNVVDEPARATRSTRCRACRARRSRSSRCRATPRCSRRPSAARASSAPTTSRKDPRYGQQRAAPRHAEGPSAGAQLSRGAGDLALRRGAGRPVLRPPETGVFDRAPSGCMRRHRRPGGSRDRQRAAVPGRRSAKSRERAARRSTRYRR